MVDCCIMATASDTFVILCVVAIHGDLRSRFAGIRFSDTFLKVIDNSTSYCFEPNEVITRLQTDTKPPRYLPGSFCKQQTKISRISCVNSLGIKSSTSVSSTVMTSVTSESQSSQGLIPVAHSSSTSPRLQISLERPYGLDRSRSGARNFVVPHVVT